MSCHSRIGVRWGFDGTAGLGTALALRPEALLEELDGEAGPGFPEEVATSLPAERYVAMLHAHQAMLVAVGQSAWF